MGYENQRSPTSSSEPGITTLSLLNTRTDAEVQPLTDGLTFDVASVEPTLFDYSVAAEVDAAGQTITRLVFGLDAPGQDQDTTFVERIAPYALFGNRGADYQGQQVLAGDSGRRECSAVCPVQGQRFQHQSYRTTAGSG